MKMMLRALGFRIIRTIGARIVDSASGKCVGRALVIPWRGKIHVIGLETPVRLVWLRQERLTYWRQEIGFTVHPAPDFPRETPAEAADQVSDAERTAM